MDVVEYLRGEREGTLSWGKNKSYLNNNNNNNNNNNDSNNDNGDKDSYFTSFFFPSIVLSFPAYNMPASTSHTQSDIWMHYTLLNSRYLFP